MIAASQILGLILGIGAAAIWGVILLASLARPERPIWPPKQGSLLTAIWAWGLTILIYVGLFQTLPGGLDLPPLVRWGLGGALSVGGSLIQGWGTATMGLRGTSGWPIPEIRTGAYARFRHPQYLGQGIALAGIAIMGVADWGWLIVLSAWAALWLAAGTEDRLRP